MIGLLPSTLTVGGFSYKIRTDFRTILQIMEAFEDPELRDFEKQHILIDILFYEPETIPEEHYEEAVKEAVKFIDLGKEPTNKKAPHPSPVMSWSQDEQLIFSSLNSVAGKETRETEYMHWWTFMGYYNEIKDGLFQFVVSIRQKLNSGQKLEKHEKEFLKANPELIYIQKQLTEEEKKEKAEIDAMFDALFY